MDEQPETDSSIEQDGLDKIVGLLDDAGDLPDEPDDDPQPQSQSTADDAGGPDTQTESPETDDQTVEVDYEGAKYRVPAAVKDAILRQADYTRKTQEVATQRAAVEQERQAVQRLQQEAQANIGQYAALQQIDAQLANLQRLDWNKLAADDPWQHLQMRQQWTEMLHARQGVIQQLEHTRQQNMAAQARALADAMRQGHEVLAKEVPDWGPELQKALLGAAQNVGYRPEEMAMVSDPRAVKLLHKAYLYDQLQQQKTVVEKQVKQVPPKKVVRPSATQGPAEGAPSNAHLARLRKTGRDEDALAALQQLGID